MEKYTENFVIAAKSTPEGDKNDMTLDEELHNSGFALASFEEGQFKSIFMHVNIAQLAEWIRREKILLTAAKLAIMRETLEGTKSNNDQSVSIEKLFGLEG